MHKSSMWLRRTCWISETLSMRQCKDMGAQRKRSKKVPFLSKPYCIGGIGKMWSAVAFANSWDALEPPKTEPPSDLELHVENRSRQRHSTRSCSAWYEEDAGNNLMLGGRRPVHVSMIPCGRLRSSQGRRQGLTVTTQSTTESFVFRNRLSEVGDQNVHNSNILKNKGTPTCNST